MAIDASLIVAGLAIIFAAGIIQGITGFGFSLLAVPLLAFFLPLQTVTPLLIVFSLATNALVLYETRKNVKIGKVWIMVLFGIIGTPIGAFALKFADANVLKAVVGIIIFLTALAMLKGFKLAIKKEKASQGIVGFASGVLNGSLTLSGPPIVLFMSNQGADKNAFRANITAYLFILNIFAVITMYAGGFLTDDVSNLVAVLLPALAVGVVLGILIARKVKEDLFKKIVLYLIIAMGAWTLIMAVRNMI